jgi:transposase
MFPSRSTRNESLRRSSGGPPLLPAEESGKSQILRAIAGGERDARKLAKFRDPHCRKSEEEIAEQLQGHWRADHIFSLQQALKIYDAIEERIGAYEKEILHKLKEMEREDRHGKKAPPLSNANKANMIKKRGQESLRQAMYRMSGVDMTQIDAVGAETVEVVLSEYGPDLSCFPSEREFVAHALMAPRVATSGGKPIKKQKKRRSASSRVASVMRMAALSMRNSPTALGAYYRRIAQRKGGDIAVFTTARKILTLIYRLLRWGQPYLDEGAEAYEKRYREMRIKSTAKQLGYGLVPSA